MRPTEADQGLKIPPLRGYQNLLFLLGLVLLWPGLLQGDITAFNDTVSYLRGADTAVARLIGHSDPFFAVFTVGTTPISAEQPGTGLVLYGRSLYFGAFLYLGLLLGSFWVPVVMQAVVAGAVIVGAVRHFVDPTHERAFLIACLAAFAVAACTPLPFFVCFLMPDCIVGLALLSATLLLCGWRRERVAWRVGFLLLLTFAALFHSSAVAVLGVLGAGGLVASWLRKSRGTALAGWVLIGTAVIGLAGEAAFGLATRLATGASPIRPPFLTARLIEDGPGRRFLAERCGTAQFVLCRYPVADGVTAEIFLWEPRRPLGAFKALPVTDAVKVSHEQTRFAWAVLRAYPADTVAALLRDFAVLATSLRLDEFRPEYVASRMRADRLFAAMPEGVPLPLANRVVSAMTLMLLLASLGTLAMLLRSARPARGKTTVAVVFLAIVLNDGICACLSGPFARYNTRVVWALPVMVLLFVLARRRALSDASQAGM